MEEEDEKGKSGLEKKKIRAILPNTQELQGDIYYVKLYSSDREGIDWLYSGLEGNFALVVDFQLKTKYIMMFDPSNYQKVFQYELYTGFEKYFEDLAPDFRSFEIDSGFIGLQFENAAEAESFQRLLERILPMKNIYTKLKAKESSKAQNDKVQNYCKILKENFCKKDSKYDENYAEDGTQILKHRNFKVLNNISYDKKKKKFVFGKISDELKEMFLSYGIKKKDLERDVDFAFSLFKKVIVGLGNENKLKNSALDRIQHTFLTPQEKEQERRQEEATEAKMYIKRTQQKRVAKTPKGNFASAKRGSVPLMGGPPPPPPPPPPPSMVPSMVPSAVPSSVPKMNAAKRASQPLLTPAEELKQKQAGLKKVTAKKETKKEENKDKNMGGAGKNFLQNALSTAIKNRRMNLHMHDEDEDDDADDDWD